MDFPTWAISLAGFALTWLVQSTVLLALGLCAGRLIRRMGPAVQSAVYRTTLAAVLVCPIASALLSRAGFDGLNLRLPPPRVEVFGMKALYADFKMVPIPPPMDVDEERSHRDFQPLDRTTAAVVPAPAQPAEMRLKPTFSARPVRAYRLSILVPIAEAALAAWLIGVFVLIVRLGVGQRRMMHLRASAVPAEADTESLCRELAGRLSLVPPAVLRSPFLFSPCLDGLRHPAILLPDDHADNLRETFIHELAHLARRDGLWNLLRRSATAILWIQPLLWILSRRLEATAEEVCDDYVVQLGADRARYADHLVELAGRALPPTAISGVGMISLRSLLARRVVRILDSSRKLSTRAGRRAVAASLLLGLAGTLLAGLLGVGGIRKEAKAEAPLKAAEAKSEEKKKPDDARTIRGQVVDPEGKPVAGARVYLSPGYGYLQRPNTLVASSVAGADGRFAIEVPRLREFEGWTIVSAAAPGFGVAWNLVQSGDDQRLQMAVDDVPIVGQIVDLEGRPIEGASLRVLQVTASPMDDLGPWLAAIERKEGDTFDLQQKYLSRYAIEPSPIFRTDAEGRFRITGIGRNRVAWLLLSGPTIVNDHLHVLTRPGSSFKVPDTSADRLDGEPMPYTTYYGASFRHAAAPTRPIVGVVRDTETGKPLAGVPIRSNKLANRRHHGDEITQTVTDAEGRFRLTGMPRGRGNQILAVPEADQPYLPCVKEVPDGPGLEPATVDFAMKRGVWIEGKVTDKVTGNPAAAWVEYMSFYENPSMKDYPGFAASIIFHLRPVKEDGSYRVAGMPGPGLIAVMDQSGYLKAPDRDDEFGTRESSLNTAPFSITHPVNYAALARIDPPKGADTIRRDVTLDPGRFFSGTVLGPDGRPMAGAWRYAGNRMEAMETAEFTISGIDPKDPPSEFVFQHPGRGLVGVVQSPKVNGERVEVKMRPGATVTGKLVDSAGKPCGGIELRLHYRAAGRAGWRSYPVWSIETDAQGRFSIRALIPEYTYQLADDFGKGTWTLGGSLKAAETTDLGDIRIEPSNRSK